MTALTPQIAQMVLQKDDAYLIRKATAGKPLTTAQRDRLAEIANAADASPDAITETETEPKGKRRPRTPRTARTFAELADLLGVSRRTLTNVRKDERFKDRLPKPRPNGLHEVDAWKATLEMLGIKGGAISGPADEGEVPEELQLRREKMRLDIAKRRAEVAEIEGRSIDRQKVAEAIRDLVLSTDSAYARTFTAQLPARLAHLPADRIAVIMREAHEKLREDFHARASAITASA